jgi:hypothetical protein
VYGQFWLDGVYALAVVAVSLPALCLRPYLCLFLTGATARKKREMFLIEATFRPAVPPPEPQSAATQATATTAAAATTAGKAQGGAATAAVDSGAQEQAAAAEDAGGDAEAAAVSFAPPVNAEVPSRLAVAVWGGYWMTCRVVLHLGSIAGEYSCSCFCFL